MSTPRTIHVTCELELWDREALPEADQELLASAHEAVARAYAPYSGFRVGAALRLANGVIVTGTNQENAAYPSGMCAERVALFHAGSVHPGVAVEAMAVASDGQARWESFSPCGGCRQVIHESEQRQTAPIRLMLQCRDQPVTVAQGIDPYLPFSFKADGLGVNR